MASLRPVEESVAQPLASDPSQDSGNRTRPHRRGVRLVGLLFLGATSLTTGCSYFLTQGPPPKAQRAPGFQCTESPRIPLADIALSVLSVGEIFHAAASARTPFPWLGAALVFGVSGGIGAGRVNDCNKAHGHPYSPHAPMSQPGMMPEDPFGLKGGRPGRPPRLDQADDEETETPEGKPGAGSTKAAAPADQ